MRPRKLLKFPHPKPPKRSPLSLPPLRRRLSRVSRASTTSSVEFTSRWCAAVANASPKPWRWLSRRRQRAIVLDSSSSTCSPTTITYRYSENRLRRTWSTGQGATAFNRMRIHSQTLVKISKISVRLSFGNLYFQPYYLNTYYWYVRYS